MQRKRWIVLFMLASLFLTSGAALAQEATEVAPLELSEHYVSDDERAAFSYPEGWVVDPRSPREGYYLDARLMSSPEVDEADFAIFGDGLSSGQVFMQPLIVERSTLLEEVPDLTPQSSLEEALEQVLEVNIDENIASGVVTSVE
ncbi:MAG: hypothetical protein K8I30_02505, partial [Anaerolineae bacterium]|nr:hypothetical protein [Anaerolineae bacterium]